MIKKKAIIAMSGGVDSSVAAYLTKKEGYDCIGATMRLYDNEDIGIKSKSCCSLSDTDDARQVCLKVKIPYYVFNFKDEFEQKVISKFILSYEKGLTPNPCIDCNKYLKFDKLMKRMTELSYDKVVTGHYAIIEKKDGHYYLKKAKDDTKDQSYVLYFLNQFQLSHLLFPLGEYKKSEIRQIAEKCGFINANKHDSQDICFVPNGDYASFIEMRTKKKSKSGSFIDESGNVIGTHSGIIHYTIGQRKGLNISADAPLYVAKKDVKNNTVTLTKGDGIMTRELKANDFNFIIDKGHSFTCKARTRYNMKEEPCSVKIDNNGTVKIIFESPQRAITSGQAVVLYDGDYVIGGGTIL